MIELNQSAGIPAPEFVATRHSFTVVFRPTVYPAPTRVETNLSLLQQDILNALSRTGATSISELMAELPPSTSLRTVRENLQRLKDLGLVTLDGRTRAARWSLSGGRIREFR